MSKKKTNKNKKPKLKYERDYKFETRAERVLELLRKTGIATKENCMRYSKDMDKYISENRFNALVKLKYIVKTKVVNKETKEVYECYQLGNRGKVYIRDNFENSSIYASNSDFHDLKQSNFLFEYYKNEDIDTYKHEKELENLCNKNTSRPDGYLINTETGEGVYIETITRNYSKQKIERKLSYCLIQNAKYHLNVV